MHYRTAVLTAAAAAAGGAVIATFITLWLLNRTLPAKDAQPLASRLIIVRHGESEGNADESLYATVPDHRLKLTERGVEQARGAGRRISELLGDSSVYMFSSPFERTLQTSREIEKELRLAGVRIVGDAREDPRIREQEWGMLQSPLASERQRIKDERSAFGSFFYRFERGESGADVSDRTSSFLESLFRFFRRPTFDPESTVVIVTHGLAMRLLLMRYFRWSVAEFEKTKNPGNASFVVLEREHRGAEYNYDHFTMTRESVALIAAPQRCEAALRTTK
jgi:broad specificity phosphatase PhoE